MYGDKDGVCPELHGDITAVEARDIPDHDVLVGGFPCQAFSVAGQRKGFEDTRGTLFFEIARIADAKRPRLMLLENVKGLLSHDGGNTFETMCAALNEIGYAVDFRILNSKHFAVPQNRERIFIVADRDAADEPWAIQPKANDVVTKAKRRVAALGIRTFNFDWPTEGDITVRLRDVLETDVDEKYYLSEEKTAKLLAQLSERNHHVEPCVNDRGSLRVNLEGVSNALDASYFKGLDNHAQRTHVIEYSRKTGIGRELEQAHCLSASDWRGLNRNQAQTALLEVRPVLTPDREEKAQNGRRFKDDGEESFTLTAQDKHGVAIGTFPRYRIRKLTPLECWRLQGFSDAAHDTVKAAGVSDSQRYKQAGNAVTRNVIAAIGKPLIERLDTKFTVQEAA